MIADLGPYPAMKDSGVPWLGKVPAHWKVQRLKTLLLPIDARSRTGTEPLLSLRREHGVVKYEEHFERPSQGGSLVGYKLLEAGQFVLNRLQANNGLVFHSKLDGLVSPDYSVFTLRGAVNPDLLGTMLRTPQCRAHFRRESTGLGTGSSGFLRLYDDRFLATRIALPELAEQAAIVRFLDHADRQIRRCIRAKQELIKLLGEQKQVIIHYAVTRGLDPNVRLKASGVEWLGAVPEHWDVVPSRAMFRHRNQKAAEHADILTASQAYGIVSRSEFMTREGRRVMQVITGREILKHVEPNDFVMSMRSFEGGLEWSRQRGAVSSAYVMLVPTESVYPPYFARLLKTRSYISALRRTSDLVRDGQALRYANFLQVPLLRVPIEEQRAIAAFLDSAVVGLDAARERTRKEADLVREYRTRMIADVVTGKLDVREIVAQLSDGFDEPQPLDEIEVEAHTHEACVDEAEAVPEGSDA